MWKHFYHASNSRECMEVNGKALQLHAVYKKPYLFFIASHARIHISTATHMKIRIRYCKSRALCLIVQ